MKQMQRMFRPSILHKHKLDNLGDTTFRFYVGLVLTADREGRLEDEPEELSGMIMRNRHGLDVPALIDGLEREGFLVRYEIDGKKHIRLTSDVSCHPNESPSKIPAPQEVTEPSTKQESTKTVASSLLQEKKSKVKQGKVRKYEGSMDEQLQAWSEDPDNQDAIRKIIRNVSSERYKGTDNNFILDSDRTRFFSELGLMKNWLIANPDKPRNRWGQFVSNWLKRATVTKDMTVAEEQEHFAGKKRTGGKSDFKKAGE